MPKPEQLTDAQFTTLLNLSKGVQPAFVPAPTRRLLLRKGYVTALKVGYKYILTITEAGREALSRLPRLRPSIPKGLL